MKTSANEQPFDETLRDDRLGDDAEQMEAYGAEAFAEETGRREAMVQEQLIPRGLNDASVLHAMRRVPRHRFVPPQWRSRAYADGSLPIGKGQTISQPYIVAFMSHLARLLPDSKVLDVGTGSGYQAAVLAEIVSHVYSIEIDAWLAQQARHRLIEELGYRNLHLRCGDGYLGWPDQAPFDAIVVAAAAVRLPLPLVDQLAVGGRLILPLGDARQKLMVIEKREDGSMTQRAVAPVAFVPMTGIVRTLGGGCF